MPARLRILLADDHAVVRQGLKLLIDSQADMAVVGEAIDGNDVIEQAKAVNPDVVVMDISMPAMNGLVATRMLKRTQPEVAVVALTRHDDETYVEELLRAGASSYVLKQSAPADFLQAIRAAAAGGVYLDSAMSSRVADGLLASHTDAVSPRRSKLSERESDVLRLIAVGHSNKEIAAQLKLSVKTVEVHKANAMRKLGLTGRVDIVRYAVLRGWLYDT
jgi:DNA-binding NarL/FixJ family response regulator